MDFSLAEPGSVRMEVFDVAGRLASRRDEARLAAGPQTFEWRALAPGLYFIRLMQESRIATARFVVIR